MTNRRGNESVEGDATDPQSDVERPLAPAEANARADVLDAGTDGDGVQRFEGDLGQTGDVERG